MASLGGQDCFFLFFVFIYTVSQYSQHPHPSVKFIFSSNLRYLMLSEPFQHFSTRQGRLLYTLVCVFSVEVKN